MRRKIIFTILSLLCLSILVPFPGFAQDKPLQPTDLFARVSDSSVTLKWTPPIDTSVVGFNVYRKEDLAGGKYDQVNGKLLSNPSFRDRKVRRGKSYVYICRAVNSDGIESDDSNITGAPSMQMKTSAVVTHMGRPVRIAVPGDVIKYNIDFSNKGFGIAKEVVIVYAIPKGTTFISGTAKLAKHKVNVSYFDTASGKWVKSFENEEDISKVRFSLLEYLPPVEKGKSGIASLKVMVNY
ncbi:hypothetical protein ACFLZ2_01035 [Candidatus Margulisiibacteriota bacterium]